MPAEELFGNYMFWRGAADTLDFDFGNRQQDGGNADTATPTGNSLTITINGAQDAVDDTDPVLSGYLIDDSLVPDAYINTTELWD